MVTIVAEEHRLNPKRRQIPTRAHGFLAQIPTLDLFTAVRITNLNRRASYIFPIAMSKRGVREKEIHKPTTFENCGR
jgi:hypothetical protein